MRHRAARHGAIAAADEPSAIAQPIIGTAAFLQQAYDTTWLSANEGAGDTIAIVDAYDDPSAESDLASFRSANGLPACTVASGCLTIINENGQTQAQAGGSWPTQNSGWQAEESLDLQAASSLCPLCHMVLVEAYTNSYADLTAAEQAAENWPGVNQISNSWGGTSSGVQFSSSSIAILASTGDSGYDGTGTEFPAADSTVTAVGGTQLAVGSSSGTRGFTETAWSGASSGCFPSGNQPSWQSGMSCNGRSISDVSADAAPATGLHIWVGGAQAMYGGTSLASPLTAAFEAITKNQPGAPNYLSPQWAYTAASDLNAITAGSNGTCPTDISYMCDATGGYSGPTGNGSITGSLVSGGPGIGGPDHCAGTCSSSSATLTESVDASSITLSGQLYPNGLATSYIVEYGTTPALGSSTSAVSVGSSSSPVSFTATVSGLSSGQLYYYRIVATNSDGTTYGYEYKAGAGGVVASSAPTITSSGLPYAVGAMMTPQTLGAWSTPPASYSYQWQDCDSNLNCWDIAGATHSYYFLASSDVGYSVRLEVTVANSYGTGSAYSQVAGPVGQPPAIVAYPSVSRQAVVGDTDVADPGLWSGNPTITYQWQDCNATLSSCGNIGGATGSSYTPVLADVGATLAVVVTATNSYGSDSFMVVVGAVSDTPYQITAPAISGTGVVGEALSASTGTWTASPESFSYQWQDCGTADLACTNINGATNASYMPTSGQTDHFLDVVVTATNSSSSGSATSQAFGPVLANVLAPTTGPSINGQAQRLSVLSANPGVWPSQTSAFSYQWRRCDASGSNCTAIDGATSPDYTLTKDDEGHSLAVSVIATGSFGRTGTATSPATGVVKSASPEAPSQPIAILGNQTSGFMTNVGDWTPQDVVVTYQWLRCDAAGQNCLNINEATSSSYFPSASDSGHTLRVVATGSNTDGLIAETSNATAVLDMGGGNGTGSGSTGSAPTGIGLLGPAGQPDTTAGIGQTLSFTTSTGVTQLVRCLTTCTVTGAGQTSYTLSTHDAGAVIHAGAQATTGGAVTYGASFVGPVLDPQVAGALVSRGRATLKTSRRAVLATATVRTKKGKSIVTLTRRHGVTGRLIAWVCPTALTSSGQPQACTRSVGLRQHARIKLATTGRLAVVVKRLAPAPRRR